MATVKKMKYQTGGDVPKGMVRGEMTGRLYPKAAMDKHEAAMADALDRQAGKGKYAPKKNNAIHNKPMKPKAQDGTKLQVSIPKKLASKGADKKISKAFESGMKKYNDSSVLKSTKTYKSGGKMKKK